MFFKVISFYYKSTFCFFPVIFFSLQRKVSLNGRHPTFCLVISPWCYSACFSIPCISCILTLILTFEDRVRAASFSTNLSQVMLLSGDTTTQLIILLFSSVGSGSDGQIALLQRSVFPLLLARPLGGGFTSLCRYTVSQQPSEDLCKTISCFSICAADASTDHQLFHWVFC